VVVAERASHIRNVDSEGVAQRSGYNGYKGIDRDHRPRFRIAASYGSRSSQNCDSWYDFASRASMTKADKGHTEASLGAPTGLLVLLRIAAVDPLAQTLVLELRAEAGARLGIVLNDHEKAMLTAVTDEQLRSMMASLSQDGPDRRGFLWCCAGRNRVELCRNRWRSARYPTGPRSQLQAEDRPAFGMSHGPLARIDITNTNRGL